VDNLFVDLVYHICRAHWPGNDCKLHCVNQFDKTGHGFKTLIGTSTIRPKKAAAFGKSGAVIGLRDRTLRLNHRFPKVCVGTSEMRSRGGSHNLHKNPPVEGET